MTSLQQLTVGELVRYSTQFLRNTCQFTGPEAPTSWGPFATGRIVALKGHGRAKVATVRWADGRESASLAVNLESAEFMANLA